MGQGMDERSEERLRFRVTQVFGDDTKPGLIERAIQLVTAPYKERVSALEGKNRASAAEKRAMARKMNHRVDVIVHDDLSLADIAEMLLLRTEGVSVAKIASLFEVAPALVKTTLDTFGGKRRDTVMFSAEMRRRRVETLTIPTRSGKRDIDIGEDEHHGKAHVHLDKP